MTSSAVRRRTCRLLAPATLAAIFVFAGQLYAAETAGSGSDPGNGNNVGLNGLRSSVISRAPASPVEEFSKRLEDFQKSVPELNKAIENSAGAIDSATDIGKARAAIDQLREEVGTLLAAVSDNGPVSQLGAKASAHIRAKLKMLGTEQRFKPEERQFLVDQWQRLQVETENAAKELADARAQFAGLLQTLQSNEDFIDELVEIRQAEKAVEVIRNLTKNIRDASAQLNKLIGSIKPPGA
jgi:DNA repair exonuclease SbcCD ATPase subunit